MERITIPFKVETNVRTFEGDWTAEEIDAGLAGEGRLDSLTEWYEPSEDGPVLVTDPERIAQLEATIQK